MKDFIAHIPTKILFGPAHLKAFVEEVSKLGKNLLLVTGGGSVERLGYLAPVKEALQEAGIKLVPFSGIEPNPLAATINKAGKLGREEKVDAVLAFGGGSVMDAAKVIACLVHDKEDDIWPFVFGESRVGQLKGALALATIPTTAATASEVTPYAVVSKPEINGKSPIAYEFIKPRVSWINPAYTTEVPAVTTQDGAADILSHVFENYFLGGNESPLTDRYCESIIKTVLETLPKVLEHPASLADRGTLLWCSTLALCGLQSAGRVESGYPLHAIEHAMSGVKHELAHGRGLATLFPAYFRWLWQQDRARDRLNRLGVEIFGVDSSNPNAGLEFIEKFESWLKENELLQSVPDLGIAIDDYQGIAQYAVSAYGDGKSLDVLGAMTVADIVDVLNLTSSQS